MRIVTASEPPSAWGKETVVSSEKPSPQGTARSLAGFHLLRDILHLPCAAGPERLEHDKRRVQDGPRGEQDRGDACRRRKGVIGRMARWSGAPFSAIF